MMRLENIATAMNEFTAASPWNVVESLQDMRIFEAPLIGVAAATDSLFERLKEPDAVGPRHKSPLEWLDGAQSVISWFLPFTETVRVANRTEGQPSTEWLYARIEGQAFNEALHRHLIDYLKKAGIKVVAPIFDGRFSVVERRSNWSERHVAFVAGLGTVSLSCSFISKRGSAGRIGSVIVDLPLEPSVREYTEKDENCSKCGTCIRRCPPQAIDQNGKNHQICAGFLAETNIKYHPRYGCGKCQTGVPCEYQIPRK